MKTSTALRPFLSTLLLAVLTIACQKQEGCTDPQANNYHAAAEQNDGSCLYDVLPNQLTANLGDSLLIEGVLYQRVSGMITEDVTLSPTHSWLLCGGVFIADGVVLTIEAGTTVLADPNGNAAFLSILQGGKVMADGHQSQPIVFKPYTDEPKPGMWGGLILNGRAQLNSSLIGEGEGGTGRFGGANDNDHSGIVRYVRVEYGGQRIGAEAELNSFSFYGVGSNTLVEYIQAYRGADDGIEILGGTVNINHVVSNENADDLFDFNLGWRGTGSYWYGMQSGTMGDKGIEGDNDFSDGIDIHSAPTLSHLVLVGNGQSECSGISIRSGSQGQISDVSITGFSNGILLRSEPTFAQIVNGDLSFAEVTIIDQATNYQLLPVSSSHADAVSAHLNAALTNDSMSAEAPAWAEGWTIGL